MVMSFSQQVAGFAKKTSSTFDDSIKAIRIQITGGILRRSPVLDSGLIQSWIATTGEPSPNVVDVPDTGEGLSASGAASAMAEAMKKANRIAQTDIDGVFWLTNNKPYVRRIEYEGWSHTKAPEGMVRITLQEFQDGMEALLKNV